MTDRQASLADMTAQHTALLESLPLGAALVRGGIMVYCNQRLARLLGYDSTAELIGHSPRLMYASDSEFRQVTKAVRDLPTDGASAGLEYELIRRDRGRVWVRMYRGQPDFPHGKNKATLWLLESIDAERALVERLNATLNEQETIFANAAIGISFTRDRVIWRCNRAFEEMFEWGPGELIGKLALAVFPDAQAFAHFSNEAYLTGNHTLVHGAYDGVHKMRRRRSQTSIWVRLTGRMVPDTDGDCVWIYQDITAQYEAQLALEQTRLELEQRVAERTSELAQSNAELRHEIKERVHAERQNWQIANHDALTGLPNRTLLNDRLAQTLTQAERHQRKFALMFLDLDRFKSINDCMGHAVGDELLKAVAERLQAVVRMSDTVARLGGDEFVIVLAEVEGQSDVCKVADKIVESMTLPFAITIAGETQQVSSAASVGISIYPEHGDDGVTLLKNADTAMYYAKRSGRSCHALFSDEMQATAHRGFVLEQRLRRAMEQGHLLLHFQPQYDAVSGGICGMEALLRWADPLEGMIAPAEFIPVAEETGLIIPIGAWVLKTALQQNLAWQHEGRAAVPVAVNFSLRQFKQADLVESIKATLAEIDYPPHLLKLEITESTLMQDSGDILLKLSELAALGIRITLDDFGTGYSSLSQLKHMPAHQLKIDQSFVRDLAPDHERESSILRAIIGMAHGLGLEVMVEGVETDVQYDILRGMGVSRFQGYLFAHPQASDQADAIFTDNPPTEAHDAGNAKPATAAPKSAKTEAAKPDH